MGKQNNHQSDGQLNQQTYQILEPVACIRADHELRGTRKDHGCWCHHKLVIDEEQDNVIIDECEENS